MSMFISISFLTWAEVISQATAQDILFSWFWHPNDGTNAEHVMSITRDLEAVIKPSDIYISASWWLGTFLYAMTDAQGGRDFSHFRHFPKPPMFHKGFTS